jgi:Ca-activated chloride channel family protein
MTASLHLTCTLSSTVVPLGGSRLVQALLEVHGSTQNLPPPLRVGFLIDVSKSMRIRLASEQQFDDLLRHAQAQEILTDGVPAYHITNLPDGYMADLPRRIDYAAEGLRLAAQYLRPQDQFALAVFAGDARRMLPLLPGSQKDRLLQAATQLDHERMGEGTNLALGLAVLLQSDPPLQRLIILTDGYTEDVSGCYQWAARARQAGVRLTTLGIGAEFNQDLLIPLADQTGGQAYYVEEPQHIPAAIQQELGQALRATARNVAIHLRTPSGVTLRSVHCVAPEITPLDIGLDRAAPAALPLGDVVPGRPLAVLVELAFQPQQAGSYRVAQASLSWDDQDQNPHAPDRNQPVDLIVNATKTATAVLDKRVLEAADRVAAYEDGRLALQQAIPGDPAATRRLREAATRLLALGAADLAALMHAQAARLEQGQPLQSDAAKTIAYATRRLPS